MANQKAYVLQAKNYPTRFNLRLFAERFTEKPIDESPLQLVYQFKDDSYLFLFNFGTLVFVNAGPTIQEEILKQIAGLIENPKINMTEDFRIEVDSNLPPGPFHDLGFSKVKVREMTFPVLRLIVTVVAESAALDYFEEVTENLLLISRRVSNDLKRDGKTRMGMKKMIQFIGEVLTTKQEVISDLYVVDAPDETWDDQMLDRLYLDMKRLFELETRYRTLEFKLRMVQETVDVIVELLRHSQDTLLEIIIIILIAGEIIWFALDYMMRK